MARGDIKTLTWDVKGSLAETAENRANAGTEYRADANYRVVRTILSAKTAPTGQAIIADVNDDGASVYGNRPSLDTGVSKSVKNGTDLADARIEKDSAITLDIDQAGSGEPGRDLTVSLELMSLG